MENPFSLMILCFYCLISMKNVISKKNSLNWVVSFLILQVKLKIKL